MVEYSDGTRIPYDHVGHVILLHANNKSTCQPVRLIRAFIFWLPESITSKFPICRISIF